MLSMVKSPRLAMVVTRARVVVVDTAEREKTAARREGPPSTHSARAFGPPDVASWGAYRCAPWASGTRADGISASMVGYACLEAGLGKEWGLGRRDSEHQGFAAMRRDRGCGRRHRAGRGHVHRSAGYPWRERAGGGGDVAMGAPAGREATKAALRAARAARGAAATRVERCCARGCVVTRAVATRVLLSNIAL
jgi:hypothetical protein